jgi:hypothetical protein
MSGRSYCTYFDHRYLPRGLVLHESLRIHSPDSTLWILCLSATCHSILERMRLPGVRLVCLEELEAFDPDLLAVKGSRSIVEYYFTCSPCFVRYVLFQDSSATSVTYVDADICFFSDAEAVFDSLGECSIGITPHRFSSAAYRSHGKFGIYNVGLLVFRNDAQGTACLDWWRARCIEWCYDRLEGDRYADQKYLERFSALFRGVKDLDGPGFNVAPWNLAGHAVSGSPAHPLIDGEAVTFFHFQGASRVTGPWFDTNLSPYGARLSEAARNNLFEPYFRRLDEAEKRLVGSGHLPAVGGSLRRSAGGIVGVWRLAKKMVGIGRAWISGNLVRIAQ